MTKGPQALSGTESLHGQFLTLNRISFGPVTQLTDLSLERIEKSIAVFVVDVVRHTGGRQTQQAVSGDLLVLLAGAIW